MGVLGYFIVACVALAGLQALAATLALLLPITLLVAVVRWPRETLGLVMLLIVAGLLREHPLACINALVTLGSFALLVRTSDLDS